MEIIRLPVGSMGTNCLILKDSSSPDRDGLCPGAIVDPGGDAPGSDTERILAACIENEVRVELIILTHAHFDHMLSLEEIRERTGAPLAIHEADAPALADPTVSYMTQFAGIDEPCKKPERLLRDGDIITIGSTELTVVHTPGHTPGSICLLSGKLMITGDTLFKGTIGRHDLIGGDGKVLMNTLEYFKTVAPGITIYPGHGNISTIAAELKSNPFLL